MKFTGEVKQIWVRVCKEVKPELLIECDAYQYRKDNGYSCIWKRMNNTCGHPTNLKEMEKF